MKINRFVISFGSVGLCLSLMGVGCTSVSAPTTTAPTQPATQQTTSATPTASPSITQLDADYAQATANRKADGLKSGNYFLTQDGSSVALVERTAPETYTILSQDISKAQSFYSGNLSTLPSEKNDTPSLWRYHGYVVLEPQNETSSVYIMFYEGDAGNLLDFIPFNLSTKTLGKEFAAWDVRDIIVPSEDHSISISVCGATQTPLCYDQPVGDRLLEHGLVGFVQDTPTYFGQLPKGYSYGNETSCGDLTCMGEGLTLTGNLYFTSNDTIQAQIFSTNDSLTTGGCQVECIPRKTVTTVQVKLGQQTVILPSTTYGMSEYTDATYGFTFWYPSTLKVASTTTNDTTNFPGGTAVETLQVGTLGGVSVVVVNSPTSSITDEPANHASPIAQTEYSYDASTKQWIESFPQGAEEGGPSSPQPADISKTTVSGLFMLPSGKRFDTTIIPLSTTRFLVVSDGGGSGFTTQLAATIAQTGATIGASTQANALQAEATANANQ